VEQIESETSEVDVLRKRVAELEASTADTDYEPLPDPQGMIFAESDFVTLVNPNPGQPYKFAVRGRRAVAKPLEPFRAPRDFANTALRKAHVSALNTRNQAKYERTMFFRNADSPTYMQREKARRYGRMVDAGGGERVLITNTVPPRRDWLVDLGTEHGKKQYKAGLAEQKAGIGAPVSAAPVPPTYLVPTAPAVSAPQAAGPVLTPQQAAPTSMKIRTINQPKSDWDLEKLRTFLKKAGVKYANSEKEDKLHDRAKVAFEGQCTLLDGLQVEYIVE
jgi:hypothetical protein